MKYIKQLNINFNNWDEIKDEKGPIDYGHNEEFYKNLINKKVKLRIGSQYFIENTPSNPADMDGVIIEFRGLDNNYCFRVQWSNGESNSYRIKDLELI